MASSSSTAAALKNGALFIAVCAVLLHSSTGQQPSPYSPAPAPSPPRLDCSNCGNNCTQRCQAMADAQARYCELALGPTGVYPYCFQQVANHTCNGNAYAARDTCTIGACTAKSCGCPCVRTACEQCTAATQMAYNSCMNSQGRIMQFCMPDCASRCQEVGYCVVVSG